MGERIFLFGPPGVGKGTQATRLAATLRGPQLGEIVRAASMVLVAVVVLDARTDALVARLSGRRIGASCQDSYHLVRRPPRVGGICDRCGGKLIQRADDVEGTVRFRQQEYAAKTQPVIDYFIQNGWPVRLVDAIGEIDQIFGRIYAAMFWRD